MSRSMFIDAAYPEEVRVAITEDGILKDFESENTAKAQTKGNIYLAKIVRIEPSLQAVFMDYGGDRHGFMSINEIHPDYYQIPIGDKEKLEKLIAEFNSKSSDENKETEEIDLSGKEYSENEVGFSEDESAFQKDSSEDLSDGIEKLKAKFYRKYRIQEIVKSRQVLLVQITKEARGNKCAALTTYISLAGRYCVFMPNSHKRNGISRRINDQKDRSRIRDMLKDLIPDQIGSIVVRTAGTSCNKSEIKRDYDGLLRLWNEIKDTTMKSNAPFLVHEEENFVKRTVRDLYTRDTEQVIIEGEDVYKQVKQFVKSTTPSHAKRIKLYKETNHSLFCHYGIEDQIETIYQSNVPLKSGGYLVIHPTEALVAIDVNSGRAIRGRNVEETALKTNLEAAEEVARQLRLRDLAGLIVVDFIDMSNKRNESLIEKKMKDVLKADRSRIQVNKISQFGLMEISRQRLRPSITENSTKQCPHCLGSGIIRSDGSLAVQIIRKLETETTKQNVKEINLSVAPEIGDYLLNYKRKEICAIEAKSGINIIISSDLSLHASEYKINVVQNELPSGELTDKSNTEPASQETSQNEKAAAFTYKKSSPKYKQRNKSNRTDAYVAGAESDKVHKTETNNGKVSPSYDGPKFELVPYNDGNLNEQPDRRKQKPYRRRKKFDQGNDAKVIQNTEAKESLDDNEVQNTEEPKATVTKKGWWQRIIK